MKSSEKILLEITAQNPKCFKIESLIKLVGKEHEPINVELSAFVELSYFRDKMIELRSQVENLFRRQILVAINNMEGIENLSQNEIDRRFIDFWNSEDVINSPELKTLQNNVQSTNFEQQVNYRRYLKDGVQFALGSLNFEIRTLFPDMDSVYQWNFTAANLQSIKVMEDPDYFEDRSSRQYGSKSPNFYHIKPKNESETFSTGKYATFMTELYSIFDKSIDDNPQTNRNFDGEVDESVIRDLCMRFKRSLEELAAKYKITNYLKPHFIVICVIFASFKMLLPRLTHINEQLAKKNDPVKQLNMRKEYYKRLFISKMRCAENSQLYPTLS